MARITPHHSLCPHRLSFQDNRNTQEGAPWAATQQQQEVVLVHLHYLASHPTQYLEVVPRIYPPTHQQDLYHLQDFTTHKTRLTQQFVLFFFLLYVNDYSTQNSRASAPQPKYILKGIFLC